MPIVSILENIDRVMKGPYRDFRVGVTVVYVGNFSVSDFSTPQSCVVYPLYFIHSRLASLQLSWATHANMKYIGFE